jgi:hypothetical protein
MSLDQATQRDIQNTVKDIAQHRDNFAADMLKLKEELHKDPHYQANRAEEMKMLGQELVKQGVLPNLSIDHVVNIGDHGTILTRDGNKLEWHNGAGRSGVIGGHERAAAHPTHGAAGERSAAGERPEQKKLTPEQEAFKKETPKEQAEELKDLARQYWEASQQNLNSDEIRAKLEARTAVLTGDQQKELAESIESQYNKSNSNQPKDQQSHCQYSNGQMTFTIAGTMIGA